MAALGFLILRLKPGEPTVVVASPAAPAPGSSRAAEPSQPQPPPPPPRPAPPGLGGTTAPLKPSPSESYYTHLEFTDLWEIHRDYVRMEHRGRMRSLEGKEGAFAPRSMEAADGFKPCDIRVEGGAAYGKSEFRTVETLFGRRTIFYPVMVPARKYGKGEEFTYLLTYRSARMGHLHLQGGDRRLLSIKQQRLPGEPPTTCIIAIPAASEIYSLTDAQPYATLRPQGWSVFFYRLCEKSSLEMIHIDFLVRESGSPLPPYGKLLEQTGKKE